MSLLHYVGGMRTQLPVPLVTLVLYAVVLVAGLYLDAAAVSIVNVSVLCIGIAALAGIDVYEWRRFPQGAPSGLAVGLLISRALLYVIVVASDSSGTARVLFLLLPFRAYFLFGRIAAGVVALALLAVTVMSLQLTDSSWTTSAEQVGDLVMFTVGLLLTLAMAAVGAEALAGRERLRHASAAAERTRVGREIHDGLGHHLTAVSLLLAKAGAFRGIDSAVADAAISDAQEASRLALVDLRRSVHTLSDSEPFDVGEALNALTRGLPVELRIVGDIRGFDDERRLVIYRSAQEAITNALRHSSATSIAVELLLGSHHAVVTVHDDGSGFDQTREGWGLRGMRERVESAGGSLLIRSDHEAGTTISVTVPRVSE